MTQILDYSAGYPGALNVRRLGFDGVIRYLRKEGVSSVRPLTVAEVADMRAYGRTIALVYQHVTKSRPTQGRAAGRHDAAWALARAREVGIEPRTIYLAVDFDALTSQYAAIFEYFAGAREVLGGRVGAYAKWDLLRQLFDRGLTSWGWQTYAWSPGHNKDPRTFEQRAHLFQRLGQVTVGGIDCDVNDVLAKNGDYGQHPAPQEEDMPTVDEILNGIEQRRYDTDGDGQLDRSLINIATQGMWDAGAARASAQRIEAGLAAVAAAVAEGDLDPDAVLARVDAAVREATAQAMAATVLPALRATLAELLGEDNAEQADAIVDRLAERLRPAA